LVLLVSLDLGGLGVLEGVVEHGTVEPENVGPSWHDLERFQSQKKGEGKVELKKGWDWIGK
jgi:hypothetical protein